MRLGGTYAPVRGATGSGIGAGGTDITAGGTYAGGVDPLAKMPGVADYTPYMDPNSMFAGLSDNESVKSGLLYQPTASNYGARMEAAGMPAFSPGLLSSFTPAGAPTYGSTPGSFMKPATGGAAGGGGSVIGAAGTSYLWPEYFKGDAKSKYPSHYQNMLQSLLLSLFCMISLWRRRPLYLIPKSAPRIWRFC